MIYKEITEVYCIDCEEQLPDTDSAFNGNTNYDVESCMFVCDECLEEQDEEDEEKE